jgi:hypothetical protein
LVNVPVWHILWDEKPAPPAPLGSLGISRLARPAAGAAALAGPRGLHGSTAGRRTAHMPAHLSAHTPKAALYLCNALSTCKFSPAHTSAHFKCQAQTRSVCSPCLAGQAAGHVGSTSCPAVLLSGRWFLGPKTAQGRAHVPKHPHLCVAQPGLFSKDHRVEAWRQQECCCTRGCRVKIRWRLTEKDRPRLP